jgi:hypothetical protein
MKTEDLLRYDRMYRAMREALDADIITFGFWTPLRETKNSSPSQWAAQDRPASPPYTHLSSRDSL